MAKRKSTQSAAWLAAPRELTGSERQQAQADPVLREKLLSYEAQDKLLRNLPHPRVPARTLESVLNSTTRGVRPTKPAGRRRWALSAAAIALALAIVLSGTGYAAAQSLPGDPLYAVKRGYEQFRLSLMADPQRQAAYQEQLAARRCTEAQQLLRLGRQGAEVELDGVLEQDANGQWSIAGVPVALQDGQEWVPGMRVQLRGTVEGMRIRMREMHQVGEMDSDATPSGDSSRYGQTPSAATVQPEATETAGHPGTIPGPDWIRHGNREHGNESEPAGRAGDKGG